jgi:hypothetical protein
VRVWRDPPPRHILVAELVNPLICLTFLGGWILVVAIMSARTGLENLPSLARLHPIAALSVLPACGLFVYFVLDAWQNAGIVTQIEVAEGSFVWTKQTLFGTRACRWRSDRITAVRVQSVGTLNLLRVRRRGGFPLGAFSRCRREEVDWAADAIRAALGLVEG